MVPVIPVAAPWPAYNEFRGSVQELAEKVVSDGHHLPQVIAYEKQNLNRANVVEALEEALATQVDLAQDDTEFVKA